MKTFRRVSEIFLKSFLVVLLKDFVQFVGSRMDWYDWKVNLVLLLTLLWLFRNWIDDESNHGMR